MLDDVSRVLYLASTIIQYCLVAATYDCDHPDLKLRENSGGGGSRGAAVSLRGFFFSLHQTWNPRDFKLDELLHNSF